MFELKVYRDRWRSADGSQLGLRAITPNDVEMLNQFFAKLSPLSRYQRFHCDRRILTDAQARYLSRVDAERHIAFMVCTLQAGQEHMVAEVRCVALGAQSWQAEYAIVVDDAWQRQGIGRRCMAHLMDAAHAYGFSELVGEVLASNMAMRQFLKAIAIDCAPSSGSASHSRLHLARLRGSRMDSVPGHPSNFTHPF